MANGLFTLKQVNQGLRQSAWTGQKPPSVQYLIVGGGASGGSNYGGGGGAGGLLTGVVPVTTGSAITVTIGGGGAARGAGTGTGINGDNSVFGSLVALGGGGGGTGNGTGGASGGSGGGGGGYNGILGGQSVVNQGNKGGTGVFEPNKIGAGGGGAGTTGLNGQSTGPAGNGGSGIASSISGTVTTYAGGGGGGCDGTGNGTIAGIGGVGGGGAGGFASFPTGANGTAGTANTGGGGGGPSQAGTSGAGGSGIVILSYPDTYAAAASTSNATVTTSGAGSVSFSGSSQYLVSGTSSNFSLGTSDFSVECWVYKTSSISDQVAVASSVTGSLDPLFFYFRDGGNAAILYLSSNGSTFDIASGVAVGTVALNTWAHLAVTRVGTTFTTYLNGVQTSTFTSAASIYKSVNSYAIGAGQTSINAFKGYVSNVRVLKGSSAYSGAFTPSTTPLTPITNTVLLLNTVSGAPFADLSTTSTTFTVTGSPAWNSASPFATGLGYKNRVYTWTTSGSITF